MKIKVYFSLGDTVECEDVKNSRKFWRMVSKHCKHVNRLPLWSKLSATHEKERVVRVVKEA